MLKPAKKPRTGRKGSEREEKVMAAFLKKKQSSLSLLPFCKQSGAFSPLLLLLPIFLAIVLLLQDVFNSTSNIIRELKRSKPPRGPRVGRGPNQMKPVQSAFSLSLCFLLENRGYFQKEEMLQM